ncbi:aspartic peptidase domain-containing protein [Nemania sp. NC0429]|nr:aspartic peptidase domain-containing protein [Nemania sp. NC0429]
MRNVAGFATGSLLAAVASAQVVKWDIERRGVAAPRLSRRADGSVEEVITNEKMRGGYFASCSVGTPPQKITLQLDTGSSDIWVPETGASVCAPRGQGCTFGSYSVNDSSTGLLVDENFQIAYVDGSFSRGAYIAETFGIGDVELSNMTMGLGLQTDIAYGLVGVGYAINEASVNSPDPEVYPNLPVVMRDEGHIKTNAYSLWLNDLGASTGNILFGGIDTDKYMGDLIRIDVQEDPQTNRISSFIVELTSLIAHSSSGEDALAASSAVPVVLDSGTTFSYLPQGLAQQVWQEVSAEYYLLGQDGGGAPLVPCALANNNGYFEFGFGGEGGPAIQVGMDELVLPIATETINFPAGSGQYAGMAACQFGIQNFSGNHFLLGDTFLRSAYVVYDLENNQIAIAPTDFNATTSNIVAFPSQKAAIPSSTPAPNQNSRSTGFSDSTPSFSAQKGFQDFSGKGNSGGNSGGNRGGNGGSNNGADDGGDGNAGSVLPALDLTKMAVMGASMGLMMFGGGMFLLF